MNYYKRHLGDYAKDTRHLSLAEHGAYNLLLDYFYSTEKPIPEDRCDRIANAYANEERKVVQDVLNEFFRLTENGWVHDRAQEEIDASRGKSLKAKESANRRWEKSHSERNAIASKTHGVSHSEGNASHKPLVNIKTPVVPFGDDDTILAAYHDILPNCQRVSVLNDKRKRRLVKAVGMARRTCAAEGWTYEAERFWRAYFDECAKDPWLRGDVANPNNPSWKQHIDCLLAEDRFAQVMDRALAELKGAA